MIKNWKPIKPILEILVWKNIKNNSEICIKRIENPIKTYIIEIVINNKLITKKFKTLNECKDFANQWMIENPEPDFTTYKKLSKTHHYHLWN